MSKGTVIIEIVVASCWPPLQNLCVLDSIFCGSKIRVSVTPKRVMLICVDSEEGQVSYESAPLGMCNYPLLKMGFAWNESGLELALNGQLVPQGKQEVQIAAESKAANGRRVFNYEVPVGVNGDEKLFLYSLLELRDRIICGAPYDLLQASGLLRKLLLDQEPLVHRINREYRLKLTFATTPENPAHWVAPGYTFRMRTLYPIQLDKDICMRLSQKNLLAATVLADGERTYSVRDVIFVCANIKGGIHIGAPSSPQHVGLLALDTEFRTPLVEYSLVTIADIGWCVLNGLEPLVLSVLKKPNNL